MAWVKQPPIEGKFVGCACCGGNHAAYPLDSIFAVGFGASGITRDGVGVYEEQQRDDMPTLQEFEDMAKADPDHDWRMYRYGPLREAEYQRQGDGHWVLIREGEGFA